MASGALSETTFAELVVGILRSNNGELNAKVCCEQLYAINSEYKALIRKNGGFRKLCSKNPERLQFINDGGWGVLRIADSQEEYAAGGSLVTMLTPTRQPGGEDPLEAIQLRAALEISAYEASQRKTPSKAYRAMHAAIVSKKLDAQASKATTSRLAQAIGQASEGTASRLAQAQARDPVVPLMPPLVPPLPGAAGGAASGALSETSFAELVEGILRRNNGQLAAPICCQQLYALNSDCKAFIKKHGGLKKLCSRHPERLQFVDDSGCGVLRCAVIHNRLEGLKDARDTHLSQSVSYDETAAHTAIAEWATSQTAPSASHIAVSPKAKVVLVDSIAKSKAALKVILESVKESKVVAIDIEGDLTRNGRLSLIQVGLESEEVFIFDVLMCPELMSTKAGPDGLRSLLSGSMKKFAKVTKLLHDCRADAVALKGQLGIVLPHEPVCTVWDTQTSHSILEGKNPDKHQVGLNVILLKYAGQINQHKGQVKHRPGLWEQRPLPQLLLEYAAQDVKYLVKAYRVMHAAIVSKKLDAQASKATASRLAQAIGQASGGTASRLAQAQARDPVVPLMPPLVPPLPGAAGGAASPPPPGRGGGGRGRGQRGGGRGGGGGRSPPPSRLPSPQRGGKIEGEVVVECPANYDQAAYRVLQDLAIANQRRIAENKNGIEVDYVEFKEVVSVGRTCERLLLVRNTSRQDRWLEACQLFNTPTCFSASLEDSRLQLPLQLHAGATTRLIVKFRPTHAGMTKDLLTLTFNAQHDLTPQSLLPNGMTIQLPSLGVMYEIDVTAGMFHSVPVIRLVQPGSPAHNAGLVQGDRILSVGALCGIPQVNNMPTLTETRGVSFDQFSYLIYQTLHFATIAGGKMILQVQRFQGSAVQMFLAAVAPRISILFSIGRSLEARCGDADLLDDIRPTAPFRRASRRGIGRWNASIRPPPQGTPPEPPLDSRPLNGHGIPQTWKQMSQDGEEEEMEKANEALVSQLALPEEQCSFHSICKAYVHFYQRLLWTEELQLESDLANFNLEGDRATKFTKDGRYLGLEVNGLAEKRPSILKGDQLDAKPIGSKDWYRGRVERVEREKVSLCFDGRLHNSYVPGQDVEIRFKLNRRPLRLFHQGLENVSAQLTRSVLFPSENAETLQQPRTPAGALTNAPFNRRVRDNPEQWQAVSRIVKASHQPYPFLLFGPPGTGKTTTLAEAILQFVKSKTDSKVLVCAPTNTAADELCKRLTQLNRSEMLRLMAYSRDPHEVESSVLPYTHTDDDGHFVIPPFLRERRVIVATLATASGLFNHGISGGHFDLVVVDEAGYAMEPEIVAVLAPLRIAQVVLGGDPKQLGPVIHSPAAAKHGLSTSMLERLFLRPMYGGGGEAGGRVGGYNERYMTRLVRNYRSHPLLLQLPNTLFYDGALQSHADPMISECRLQWEGLPRPGVPLFWDGVEGKEEREANSPSWFNRDEAVRVLKHVQSLRRMRPDCRPEHIGIITGYNKQVHKIKRLLNSDGLGDIKVGSTEMFQGQERQIIIISTVRSSLDMMGFDVKHSIGFLDNPKRFNVAVTRACCMLIIVGNPSVFINDPHWGRLLDLCQEQGAYEGIPIRHRTEHDFAVAAQKLQDLLLDESPEDIHSSNDHAHEMPMPDFES